MVDSSKILAGMQTEDPEPTKREWEESEDDLLKRSEDVRNRLAGSVAQEQRRKSRGRLRRFLGAALSTVAIVYLVVWLGPWMPWTESEVEGATTESLPTQESLSATDAETLKRFDRILGALEARQNVLNAQLQNGQRPIPELDSYDLLQLCTTGSLLTPGQGPDIGPSHVCVDGEWRALAPTKREGVR